jgi:hypothetical protein
MRAFKLILAICVTFLSSGVELAARADAALITLTEGQSATFLYDGATSSPACSLCDASINLTFNGSSLFFSFSNTSTDSVANVNILTQFGFKSTPDMEIGSATFGGAASSGWSFKDNGLGGFEFGATHPGINGGLEAGQTGTVSVLITNAPTILSLGIDQTQTHFQSINSPGGTSTKPEGAACTTNCTPTQVPEAASFVLAGFGLLMLAAVARKQIRK